MTRIDLPFSAALAPLAWLADARPDALLAVDVTRLLQFTVNGVIVGSILALAAVGLTLVYGILRIANFAHGDLLTFGAYLALYLFALLALPQTLTWGLGTALLLSLCVGADAAHGAWARRRGRGVRPVLARGERLALGYAAAALVALVAGSARPAGWAPGPALLAVAVVFALPCLVRAAARAPGDGTGRGLLIAGGAAAGAWLFVHFAVPLQTGPGGLAPTAEAATALVVLALGCLSTLRAPSRDPWVLGGGAIAGLLALVLFATPLLLAVALALAGVALFSVVLERVVWRRARRQGAGLVTLIILSIGIMLALRNTLVILWGTGQRAFPDTLRRGASILGSDVVITPHQALAVGVALLTILLLHLFLRHARIGKAMRALADDMDLARVSGVDVDRVIVYVWMISGALAALAGILYAFVRPFDPNLGWFQLLPIFAAVILGGIGSPYGALLGAFTIGIAMETSPFFGVPTAYKLAVGFGILILVMIVRPTGILGVRAAR